MKSKVGFIGFGKMGQALSLGAVRAKIVKTPQVVAFDLDVAAQKKMRKAKFHVAKNVKEIIQKSDFIFLCVKPQQMGDLLQSIKLTGLLATSKKKCFVSIAAGVPLSRLEKSLGKGLAVVRVMPNTPALLGAGMSAMSIGASATPSQVKAVTAILSSVGDVVMVNDEMMHGVTALSGSGPAYGFYLAEAMLRVAKELGFRADLAKQLVYQTLFGVGRMLIETRDDAQVLRKNVTSPGGTTEAAIKEFDKHNLKDLIAAGIKRAALRSMELSK